MKKILFTTEFSEHAPEVFKFASELAYHFKAQLVVMNVHPTGINKLLSDEELDTEVDQAYVKTIEFVTQHLPIAYRDSMRIDYVVKKGRASKTILETALEHEIELIVIGMTGKTNAISTLFGSTAMTILSQSECPVLAIPAGAKFEGIDNLVYTTNFEFRDLEAINHLRKWSKKFDALIHCLHIVEEKDGKSITLKNMHILKETYKRNKRLTFNVEHGVFIPAVEKFSKKKQADIVAMITHKQNFINRLLKSSTVKGVANGTKLPLLVIKDNAFEVDLPSNDWLTMFNGVG